MHDSSTASLVLQDLEESSTPDIHRETSEDIANGDELVSKGETDSQQQQQQKKRYSILKKNRKNNKGKNNSGGDEQVNLNKFKVVTTETGEVTFVDPREPVIKTPFAIFKYLGAEFIWVFIGIFGGAVSGAIPVVLYQVMGNLIDGLQPPSTAYASSRIVKFAAAVRQAAMFKDVVKKCAIDMSIIAAVSWGAAFLQHFFMNLAHDRFGIRLRKAYFDSLLNQEIGYFDMKRVGTLVSELADTELIQDGYSTKLGEIVKNLVQSILGIVLGIVAGWRMALVMLSVGPLLFILLAATGVVTKYFVGKITETVGGAAAVANEAIGAIRTVRSMDGEEKEKKRYSRELRKAHPWYLLKATGLGLSLGLVSFCIWGAIAIGFWYGGREVIQHRLTIGSMFRVFGLNLVAVIGLLMGMQFLPDLSKAEPAIRNMLKVIERKPGIPTQGGLTPNKIVGNVEFRSVNFSYPTRPDVQVLKDFSLQISPGQHIALVGASGSGKSTIVGLLERFYLPDSGQIILDGVNLDELDPTWLHRNIGIVTQEPTLFAGTIRDNICYAIEGVREATEEEIINAAKAANAHDFISALPQGYNTIVGEKGTSLSGGQKQRVAIARAMIQNPSLLLLDEATSALDTQSEEMVQDALTKLMKHRTSIVIAHRLSTIVDSDVICVLHKGELKEKGTHHSLLQIKDGYYTRLAKKQMMMGGGGGHNHRSTKKHTSTDQDISDLTDVQTIDIIDVGSGQTNK